MATFSNPNDALDAIKAHPVCGSYLETPGKYAVFYCDPYRIPGGVAVQKSGDALADLSLLYDRMEQFWQVQRLRPI